MSNTTDAPENEQAATSPLETAIAEARNRAAELREGATELEELAARWEPVVEGKTPWTPTIPAYATESEAGMDRFMAELRVDALEELVVEFREAIVEATRAARSCFAEVAKTFEGSADDVEAEGQTVEGLLARALLLLTMHVDEAAEARRRDVARLAEGDGA